MHYCIENLFCGAHDESLPQSKLDAMAHPVSPRLFLCSVLPTRRSMCAYQENPQKESQCNRTARLLFCSVLSMRPCASKHAFLSCLWLPRDSWLAAIGNRKLASVVLWPDSAGLSLYPGSSSISLAQLVLEAQPAWNVV